MKKVLLIFAVLLSVECFSQKSSLIIKTGFTSSNIDNYNIGNDSNATNSLSFVEAGMGYTYKAKNWFWLSVEPGVKVSGFSYETPYKTKAYKSSPYVNIPVVSTFNIGAEKLVVGIDLGINNNFGIGGSGPKYYTEALVGARAGYKVSNKLAFEIHYRYGESLNKFVQNQTLSTNYICLNTRIFLGK